MSQLEVMAYNTVINILAVFYITISRFDFNTESQELLNWMKPQIKLSQTNDCFFAGKQTELSYYSANIKISNLSSYKDGVSQVKSLAKLISLSTVQFAEMRN